MTGIEFAPLCNPGLDLLRQHVGAAGDQLEFEPAPQLRRLGLGQGLDDAGFAHAVEGFPDGLLVVQAPGGVAQQFAAADTQFGGLERLADGEQGVGADGQGQGAVLRIADIVDLRHRGQGAVGLAAMDQGAGQQQLACLPFFRRPLDVREVVVERGNLVVAARAVEHQRGAIEIACLVGAGGFLRQLAVQGMGLIPVLLLFHFLGQQPLLGSTGIG